MKLKISMLSLLYISNIYALELSTIKTFESRFEQVISSTKKDLKYTGSIFLKSPSNGLWIYDKPNKKIFLSQKNIIIEETALEQVIIAKMENDINIIEIIKNAKHISPNEYSAKVGSKIFSIKTSQNEIFSISYKDEFEHDVQIIFKNQKINQPLPNKIFDYNIPDGFDVIRRWSLPTPFKKG